MWITWGPNALDVQELRINRQTIDCKVLIRNSGNCYNTREERYELWRDLTSFSRTVGNFPWLVMRDFNVVICQEEEHGWES